MQMFMAVNAVYLHREPVDFRKSINGLSVIAEQDMKCSVLSGALFLFCNRRRDKVKCLYWDRSGFALWYKRLEEEKFKWPRKFKENVIELSEQQLHWLLQGYDISQLQSHRILEYQQVD